MGWTHSRSENLNLSHARENNVLPMTEDLLKTSIVSIHLVLGERYLNLIGKKEINMMKKNAFLINTSRGPINEKELITVLENNVIAGAGLDVYNTEPLPQDHKLRFLPNAFDTSLRVCDSRKFIKILPTNDGRFRLLSQK